MNIEKLKEKFIKVRKDQWLLVLLAGILLVVIALPMQEEQGEVQEAAEASAVKEGEDATDMEARLADILSKMEGAGTVRVMITLKSSAEKIVEKDIPSSDRDTQEQDESGSKSTVEKERDETTVYERDEKGNETPYVTQELAPQVEGVLVLAEGGDNAVVIKNITEAVMALFNLEAHKIKVMKTN